MRNNIDTYWQQIKSITSNISSFGRSAFTILIVLLFDRFMISNGSLMAQTAPMLAVVLAWIWFMLPGYVLSNLLANKITWWERIPISFVLSIGLFTPVTIYAILKHYSLDDYIVLHSSILLLQIIIWIIAEWQAYRIQEQTNFFPEASISRPIIHKRNISLLFIIATILVCVLAILAAKWPIYGDEVAGMSIFAEVLHQNQITGTEPFHGTGIPVTPRNELIVWTYNAILTDYISGTSPSVFFINSRPVLVIVALLSLVVMLNQFLKNKEQSLFFLCLWGIYLLSTMQADGSGSDFITRIIQDKFLGWFVIIPVLLSYMVWYVEKGSWGNLIGFGIVTFGASMVHPITLTQAMILTTGFGVILFLFDRSRKTVISLCLIALVLVVCTIVPFYQYIRFNDYSPIQLAGLADAVEFGQLSSSVGRYRLWMLGEGRFILHPNVILEPVIIAAYLLLPVVINNFRKYFFPRLIVGSLLILLILLYTPTFAGLAGRVVTPYLIWRLAWPIPLLSVMAVGWVIWHKGQKLSTRIATQSHLLWTKKIFYPSLLIIILSMAAPQISRGMTDYNERKTEINLSTCITAENALSYLNEIASQKGINVLASHSLNFCIPGYAALANVVEFRGYGTVNRLAEDNLEDSLQRIDDVNYFSVAKYYDDLILGAIIRHQIDYVLIEKERLELDFQLHYSPIYFQSVYEDANYSLYAVKKPLAVSRLVEANTALRTNQFPIALQLFNLILYEEPTNILAHLGLGLAQAGLGDYDQAIKSLQNAIKIAPTAGVLHGQLANIYVLKEDIDNAIKEYQMATNLAPKRYSLYVGLGQIYILAGQDQAARESFEHATLLVAVKDTAGYYTTLGHLYSSVNLPSEAIQYFTQAIAIEADVSRYIDLARVLSTSGKADEAIQVYQLASESDRWNYLPHLELGYLYLEQDQIDKSIQELEIACQLKPTNVSAYIMLGRAIEKKAGLEAALSRLEELKKLSDVLPGPSRGIASLLFGYGDYEYALDELGFSANIQPKNAAILIAKGYISMAEGKTNIAQEDFTQALLYKPDLISARLGLSMFYTAESEYKMATSQFIQIVQLIPLTAWSHLNLAQAYQQQGNWELAENEIRLAIKLEPRNVQGYLARARLMHTLLDYEQAIVDYKLALTIDPNNETALLGLGDVYYSMANFDEAEKLYISAAEADVSSVFPKMKLLDLYWQQGRYQEVAGLEKTLIDLAPDSVSVIYKLAELYRKQGRIDEARACYERLIQKDPSGAAAYTILVQLLAEGDNDQYILLSMYNDLLSENSESPAIYLAVGRFLIDQSQFDLAERILQTALLFNNATDENYLALSHLQQKRGDWQSALDTLMKAQEKFPASAVILTELGEYYINAGYNLIAKVYFTQAIEYDPTFTSAYVGLSQVALINEDYYQSETNLLNASDHNPASTQIYIALADFYEATGRIDLAEDKLSKAISLKPSDINLQRAFGQFYVRQHRFQEALAIYQKALQLPGIKLDTYLDIGNLYLAENSAEEAINWFELANNLSRGDTSPYLALSVAYQSINDWDNALQNLNTALMLEPANIEVNLAMGKLYWQLGDYDTAISYIKRASEFDQSNPIPLVLLAEISRDKGQFEEAKIYLEQSIKALPVSLPAYTILAQVTQWEGNPQRAEEILSEGIQRAIYKQEAYLARASFYEQQALWDLARSDYEQAWNLSLYSKSSGLAYIDFLTRRNDLDNALKALNKLESQTGTDAEIKVRYGDIYSIQGKWIEAGELYQAAIEINPTLSDGYLGLARVREAQGDTGEAIAIYQMAIKNASNSPEIYVRLGNALQSQALYEQAYLAFEDAINLDPLNIRALLKLEQLNKALGKPEMNLLDYIQQALTFPSAKIFTTIGEIYSYRGEWTLALTWIQRAVNLEPCNSENWFILGNFYRTLAQWDKALEAYNLAEKYSADTFEIWMALGAVEEALGELENALDSYQKAIEASPLSIEGYIALSKLYYQLENNERAIQTMNEGILQAPADYRGYQALGELYIAINPSDISSADEVFQNGLRVSAGTPELITSIADLFTKRVMDTTERLNTSQAIELLAQNRLKYLTDLQSTTLSRQQSRVTELKIEEAVRIVGSYHARVEEAQQAYEQAEGYFETASEHYKYALDIEPNEEGALVGMGKLYLAEGLLNESIAYFERAASANPHSTLSLSYLGNIYLELGQPEKAITYFQQILTYDPGNMLAKTGISYAYQDITALDISQAADSVEQSQFKIQLLVEYFRKIQD